MISVNVFDYEFLIQFIQNVQIDRFSANKYPELGALNISSGYFDFPTKPHSKLEKFFASIKIPYLLPHEIMTDDIQNKLEGLCTFGYCYRLAGNKTEFDLLYKNSSEKGFIDYSHIDGNLNESYVTDFINLEESSKYPVSIFIAHSLDNELKTENYFRKKPTNKRKRT